MKQRVEIFDLADLGANCSTEPLLVDDRPTTRQKASFVNPKRSAQADRSDRFRSVKRQRAVMTFTAEQKAGLDTALNEATLLGLEVRPDGSLAGATLAVLSLPPDGSPPEDPRVQLQFAPVGRVVASLRLGSWDDYKAQVVPFPLSKLLEIVQEFGGQPIYGSEFVDVHDAALAGMAGRHSLDFLGGPAGMTHSIRLSQEGSGKYLDICLWFDHLRILRPPVWEPVSLEEFIAGGKRWWDGLHAGDPRTVGHGIVSTNEISGVQLGDDGTVLSTEEFMRLNQEAVKFLQSHPGQSLTQAEFLSLRKEASPQSQQEHGRQPSKILPSWAGFIYGPFAGAIAGWRIGTRNPNFTQLEGAIGGICAGLVAGLIVWGLDRRRKKH
jgi:hypothetical protein